MSETRLFPAALRTAALCAMVAAVGLLGALVTTSKADAAIAYEEFCINANLGPYGQSTDSCAGGGYRRQFYVQVQAFTHSACASSTTNGAKSGVNVAWVCTAGGGGVTAANWVNSSVYTYGIIRNNTTGDTNRATGVVGYEYP